MNLLFKICLLTLAWGADSNTMSSYPDTQPIVLADGEIVPDSFADNGDFVDSLVQPKEFPHHVTLQYNHKAKEWRHFCSASIINDCAILTTISCYNIFENDTSDWVMKVIAGAVDLSLKDEPNRQETTGQYIYQHPKFDKNTLNYDFAVVYLRNCFTFNDEVKSINLTQSGDLDAKQNCTTSGWDTFGLTSNTIDPTRDQTSMKKSELNAVLKDECKNKNHGNKVIADTMFCTNGSNPQSVRDLGAPLVCDGVLTGIMTYPEYIDNNSSGDEVSIFSKVFSAKDWIMEPYVDV